MIGQEAVELYQENHLCFRCSHGDVCSSAKALDPDLLQTIAICLAFDAAEAKPGDDPTYVRTVLTGIMVDGKPAFRHPNGGVFSSAIPLENIGIRVDGLDEQIEVLVRDIPREVTENEQ